jgi:hypothetical protein
MRFFYHGSPLFFPFLLVLFLRVFIDIFLLFLQKVRFLPDATLQPLTFLHLFGFLTLFHLHNDFLEFADIVYIINLYNNYELGRGAKHSLISPREATLYFTTSGRSFSKYTSI